MCGIVGLIAKNPNGFYNAHLDIFEEMLIADSLRGQDSTGAFCIMRNNGLEAIKHDTHPFHTLATEEWKDFSKAAVRNGCILVGHNRAATKGVINNQNAHPFIQEPIALVHNGTIYNHKEIADTEVDSEAIAHGFAKGDYKPVLKKINGAWALVWYNRETRTLYLTRNADRPLSVLETSDLILFGSELPMLSWIAARNRLTHAEKNYMRPVPEKHVMKFQVSPNYHFEIEDITKDIEKPPVNHYSQWPRYEQSQQIHTVDPPSKTTAVIHLGGTKDNKEEDIEQTVLFQNYPRGTKVMWEPRRVFEAYSDGSPRFKAEGVAWRPGCPVAPCRVILPGVINSQQKALEFLKDKVLVADVMMVASEGGKLNRLILQEPTQVCFMSTWPDKLFPWEEFEMLQDSELCSKCHGEFDINYMDTTSIVPDGNQLGKYKCVCHLCVIKSKPNMNKEHQSLLESLGNVIPPANQEQPSVQ